MKEDITNIDTGLNLWYKFTSWGHELRLKTSSLGSRDFPTGAIGTPEVSEKYTLLRAAHAKNQASRESPRWIQTNPLSYFTVG